MITVQDNIQSYIDKSGHDTVKIEYNGQSKTLKRKGVSTVASENPFTFFVRAYRSSNYNVRASNLDSLYSRSISAYYFAVDRSDESFFVNESNVLYNRTKAGVAISSVSVADLPGFKPFIFDGTYLYGIFLHYNGSSYDFNKTIYRFSKDLQTRDDWSIKVGTFPTSEEPGEDYYLYSMCLSQDGQYIYIAAHSLGAGLPKIAKFTLSAVGLLDDPIWNVDPNSAISSVYTMQADEDGNLYVGGLWPDPEYEAPPCNAKLLANTGEVSWYKTYYDDDDIGTYLAYSNGTKSVYSSYNYWGDSDRVIQLDASDGSVIGKTVSIGTSPGTPIIGDDNTLIIGVSGSNPYIYTFDISDDWGESENYIDSAMQIGTSIQFTGLGDPSGYINSKINGGSAHCHGYEVDIKTKTKIEEIN